MFDRTVEIAGKAFNRRERRENPQRTPRDGREERQSTIKDALRVLSGLSQRTRRLRALSPRPQIQFQALGSAAGSPKELQRPRIP